MHVSADVWTTGSLNAARKRQLAADAKSVDSSQPSVRKEAIIQAPNDSLGRSPHHFFVEDRGGAEVEDHSVYLETVFVILEAAAYSHVYLEIGNTPKPS